MKSTVILLCIGLNCLGELLSANIAKSKVSPPIVVATWNFPVPTSTAYESLTRGNTAVEALEVGCNVCEDDPSFCNWSVGYGAKPDESGETTLDAMIMDGTTMDAGAVGHLRDVKRAISVAHAVMKYTKHTMLVGNLATEFAVQMGFERTNLSTTSSVATWMNWKNNNCRPNFWENVNPDPASNCGPYTPAASEKLPIVKDEKNPRFTDQAGNEINHDTIGMIILDDAGNMASGTSTNGLTHKIAGRVGDSPVVGAGSYADSDIGAAAATGNGDVMMRFLPSFLAVEIMRTEPNPSVAASIAIARIVDHYPEFSGAIITLSRFGEFGAACHNQPGGFPFAVMSEDYDEPRIFTASCTSSS